MDLHTEAKTPAADLALTEPAFGSDPAQSASNQRPLRQRTVVTGMGGAGPLGMTNDQVWDTVICGGIEPQRIRYFDPEPHPCKIAWHVDPAFEPWDAAYSGGPIPRAARFAIYATQAALLDSHVEELRAETPVLIGTSTNAFEEMIRQIQHAPEMLHSHADDRMFSDILPRTYLHAPGVEVANAVGLNGLAAILSTACDSALTACSFAMSKIRAGESALAIVGGTDAPINTLIWNSFAKHGLLTSDERIYVLDGRTTSSTLSEGSVAFIVESAGVALERGARFDVEIESISHFQDNSLNPDRRGHAWAECMRRALGDDRQVDLVVMHAPGHAAMEALEVRALKRVFGTDIPAVTSQKGTYGAGGAYHIAESLRLAILMMQRGVILPTIASERPAKYSRDLDVVREVREHNLERVLLNARALGGTIASVVLRRFKA